MSEIVLYDWALSDWFPYLTFNTDFSSFNLKWFFFSLCKQWHFILLGGIFPENSDHLVNAFQNAARLLNTFSELVKFQPTTVTVDTNDSFKVQKAGKTVIKNHSNQNEIHLTMCISF